MKRFSIITFILFCLAATNSFSQSNRAIGLRIGGGNSVGAEISFQTPLGQNRGEFDLGIGGNANWNFWNLTGIYQWVMPIDGDFYWYLGLGPTLGSWSYQGRYPYDNKGGVSLALALNAGVEYSFPQIPLKLSLDTRPEIGFTNTYSHSWFGLAMGVRYVF